MKKKLTGVGHVIVMCGLLTSTFAAVGGPIAAKIAAKCEVKARDAWYGYDRTVFVFDGEEAWVVEPKAEKAGRPWCWTMEWPGAFAKRAASVALLAAGYHHVALRPGEYQDGKFVSRPGNMTDRRLAKSRAFQKFLVTELGFAPKANLIGMSWGGFYSVRYAGTHPDAVAHIYLDAPLLDFSSLTGWNLKNVYKTYGITDEKYCGLNDPRQPVNMAEPIAKAGIPILLLYGGQDRVVPPAKNCKPFAERFQKAGGQIEIVCREAYAHHPHGLEIDEQDRFVAFFGKEPVRAARPVPRPALARRLADESLETYGIVHWGLNTFTDREWGFGDEDPALLNPTRFDALQIASACRAGGLGGLIVVAKHHDGFCLWPTKTTAHNISRAPFRRGKGDYVREMEQACRKTGLRFGVYVSPWDRNSAGYGSERYVKEVFQAQIRELLSGDYGEIFEMWFDGANGGDGYYGVGAGADRTGDLI